MNSLLNVVLFLGLVALAVLLWWPGFGVLRRGRRASSERVETEDALKHIYHGEMSGHTVTPAGLAGAMEASQASVVALLERMHDHSLVNIVDGRVLLTDEGNRYALQVIRAHRLWERYLADETGIHPTDWHAEAERREHTLTPEDADELSRKLGNPRFDPHGDPIPTADGAVPEKDVSTLAALDVGDRAHVVHIEDEPEVVFAQLVAIGVYLGMVVRVDAKTEERIVFEADGRPYVLAPLLAANVSVQRLESEVPAAVEEGTPLYPLGALGPGEVGEVVRISPACRGIERRRLMDLGVVPGTHIEFERRGLTGGLSAYRVRGTVIALREEQTDMISITRVREVAQ